MKCYQKLKDIIDRCESLEEQIGTDHTLLKEYGQLAQQASLAKDFFLLQGKIEDQENFLEESKCDREMSALISEELTTLNDKMDEIKAALREILSPKDKDAGRNVFIEVRAGTGGFEASLFCVDLIKMYSKLCERLNWCFTLEDFNMNDVGGYKECIAQIKGKGVYGHLRHESGVHRVQRVPSTESSGRIHTSAVSVVVFPVVHSKDFHLDEKELRIDVFRSSGAGGQHANKTESAVRLTHIPTGLVAVQQSERSQHKNKQRAMEILRAKVYEMEEQEKQAKIASERKIIIGSGDRSQKIRTYNFLQNRVTDHRIGWNSHNLENFINGNSELSSLLQKLMEERSNDH